MQNVTGYQCKVVGSQHLCFFSYGHLELAFQHKAALLMRVPVQRYAAACCYLYKVDGIVTGMNEFAEKAGCNFFNRNVGKLVEHEQ